MRHMLFSISLSVIASLVLVGCGGGKHHKKSEPPTSSSAASSTAAVSSKSSAAVSSSSSSSSVTSSVQSSAQSSQNTSAASSLAFTLTSNSFESGAKIPSKYSCVGTQASPHLKWDVTSPDIKSFVLIMEDKDAIQIVGYPYVHWDVYSIPADTRELVEGASLHGTMPLGSIEGVNDDGGKGYAGPCPPEGTGTHHYFFAIYAINQSSLPVNSNAVSRRADFEAKYASSIIQKAEMSGTFIYQ